MCRPKSMGGLGIKGLVRFGRALRLRRLWYEWRKEDSRPWVGTEVPCDRIDRNLFDASTKIIIGDGRKARFWTPKWLNGQAVMDLAPNLSKLLHRKSKTVREGISDANWIRQLRRINSAEQFDEFIALWLADRHLTLHETNQDDISWVWTVSGEYAAESAYEAQFRGSFNTYNHYIIWRANTENRCKFFSWLLIQNKVLSADKLALRGWPNSLFCPLCATEEEPADHLFLRCSFARHLWLKVVQYLRSQDINLTLPQVSQNLAN